MMVSSDLQGQTERSQPAYTHITSPHCIPKHIKHALEDSEKTDCSESDTRTHFNFKNLVLSKQLHLRNIGSTLVEPRLRENLKRAVKTIWNNFLPVMG